MRKLKIGDRVVVYKSGYGYDDIPVGCKGVIVEAYVNKHTFLSVKLKRPNGNFTEYNIYESGKALINFSVKLDLSMLFEEDI